MNIETMPPEDLQVQIEFYPDRWFDACLTYPNGIARYEVYGLGFRYMCNEHSIQQTRPKLPIDTWRTKRY